ncbi:hypothetical protein HAX54_007258 [Datura stramonium]|uniref:Vacuolar iron transporter n=1 Tax=Datura stramonium TaxID=4076 RepID=A0ABS8TCQ9_DATST|nr:hypothetical protein [Datura stramonium]
MNSPESIEACTKKEPLHATAQEEKTSKKLARAQWLRAAILGANDGLLSTTSLMLGVGAAKDQNQRLCHYNNTRWKLLYESPVQSHSFDTCKISYDKRCKSDARRTMMEESKQDNDRKLEPLPSPLNAAAASSLAFLFGAFVPMVPALLVVKTESNWCDGDCSIFGSVFIWGVIRSTGFLLQVLEEKHGVSAAGKNDAVKKEKEEEYSGTLSLSSALQEEEATTTDEAAASLSSGKTDEVVGNAKMRRKSSHRKWRLGSCLRMGDVIN